MVTQSLLEGLQDQTDLHLIGLVAGLGKQGLDLFVVDGRDLVGDIVGHLIEVARISVVGHDGVVLCV